MTHDGSSWSSTADGASGLGPPTSAGSSSYFVKRRSKPTTSGQGRPGATLPEARAWDPTGRPDALGAADRYRHRRGPDEGATRWRDRRAGERGLSTPERRTLPLRDWIILPLLSLATVAAMLVAAEGGTRKFWAEQVGTSKPHCLIRTEESLFLQQLLEIQS